MQGVFITFEGIDGSGKTTQCKKLKTYLEESGLETVFLREPGSTKISEQIRQILLNPENTEMAWRTETILYAAARAQLVQEAILPALKSGKIVVCDRFIDSSIAYQGYGRGICIEAIKEANALAIQGIKSDITFLLDITPSESVQRIDTKRKVSKDRLENETISFYRKVSQGYLELAASEPQRIKVITGKQDESIIHQKIIEYILPIIKRRKLG